MTGIPTRCTVCGAPLLNPHELTGLCLEDKLIERNERMAAAEAEVQVERRKAAVARALRSLAAPDSTPAPRTDSIGAYGDR